MRSTSFFFSPSLPAWAYWPLKDTGVNSQKQLWTEQKKKKSRSWTHQNTTHALCSFLIYPPSPHCRPIACSVSLPHCHPDSLNPAQYFHWLMGWPPPPYSRSYLVTQVYKIGPTVQRSVCNGGLCCVLSNPAVSQMQCFIWGRLRLLLYYDGRRQATQVPLGKCILRERIKSMIKMRCNLSSCPFSLRWGEARSYSWCVM